MATSWFFRWYIVSIGDFKMLQKLSNNLLIRIINLLKKIVARLERNHINNHNLPNAQGLIITSPIDHNSQERMNDFYSDPLIVERYLGDERLKFYQDVISFFKITNVIII